MSFREAVRAIRRSEAYAPVDCPGKRPRYTAQHIVVHLLLRLGDSLNATRGPGKRSITRNLYPRIQIKELSWNPYNL
jgi:hypothetical protein